MTADSPRDYSVDAEGPRDICANLAQIFRGEVMMRKHAKPIEDPDARWAAEVLTDQFANWASRLERAVQQLDAEQAKRGEDQKRSEGEDAWQHLW